MGKNLKEMTMFQVDASLNELWGVQDESSSYQEFDNLFDDVVKPLPAPKSSKKKKSKRSKRTKKAKKAVVAQRRHVYPNGTVYDGEWDGDSRSGHGVCMYTNGDKYVGDWADDKG